MGNEAGKPTCPLGLAAMASTTSNIEMNEVMELFKKLAKLAHTAGNPEVIARADLETAMKSLDVLQPSDTELLDKMFTMFDNMGEGTVDFREFAVAVSTLVSG